MSPDSTTTEQAMIRLRSADPAATAPALRLSAGDILASAEDETLVDTVPHRSRTRWLLPLAAAAVALLVVGGFLIRNSLANPDAPIAGTPVGPQQVAANCDVDEAASESPPTDAVSVSLCDHSFDGGQLSGPPDALVDNIDQFIAAFDELEPASDDMACTQEMGPAYDLVFTEADGTTTVVSGELYGCRTVGDRLGADTYLDQFTDLLLEQRADRGPWKGQVEPASCDTWSWIVATPEAADRTAMVCLPNNDGTFVEVPVEDEDLATLRADLSAHTAPASDHDRGCSDRVILVLASSYGDQVAIEITCGVGEWQTGVRGGQTLQWELSSQSREIIQRLAES